MKFVRITTVYPSYLADYCRKNMGSGNLPFQRQMQGFLADGFGWADFWTFWLQPLGYKGDELVANFTSAQEQWVEEFLNSSEQAKLPPRKDSTGRLGARELKIVELQLKRLKPEILFVDDYQSFQLGWLKKIRKEVPSIRLIYGWCGAPYTDAQVFLGYDAVLTCVPELKKDFEAKGHVAHLIPHGFDPRILKRIAHHDDNKLPVTFIGQIVRGHDFHLKREELLKGLVHQVPLTIFSPNGHITNYERLHFLGRSMAYQFAQIARSLEVPRQFIEPLPKMKKVLRWKGRPKYPVSKSLAPYIHPAVFGIDMFQTLSDSRLTINNHIDISANSASNMRLFEATGAGTCLVTDAKNNQSDLFDIDREIVTYESTEECIEKVRYLLDHPDEAKEIALRGQTRTLKDHNFSNRAQLFDSIVRASL